MGASPSAPLKFGSSKNEATACRISSDLRKFLIVVCSLTDELRCAYFVFLKIHFLVFFLSSGFLRKIVLVLLILLYLAHFGFAQKTTNVLFIAKKETLFMDLIFWNL